MSNESPLSTTIILQDPWQGLQQFTAARIALGRTGAAVPLQQALDFKLAHAFARDAVYSILDKQLLTDGLQAISPRHYWLHSQAIDRATYLQRPDFGRRLNDISIQQLSTEPTDPCDIAIVLVDGLSATAINEHALPYLQIILPALQAKQFTIAPITVVQQGRVAIGDEIGTLLKAKLTIVLIGERPGLSSPNSMGAYITYQPALSLTDESRNCISNIRPEGLPLKAAADTLLYLVSEALRLQLSGVGLKDDALTYKIANSKE
jgi:ethanolamine ammonia-lyase small subunit